jgi:hypothetical protein
MRLQPFFFCNSAFFYAAIPKLLTRDGIAELAMTIDLS